MYTTTRPSPFTTGSAPSCLKRPRALRFFGVEAGSSTSTSTTQPKRLASFGPAFTSKRLWYFAQAYQSAPTAERSVLPSSGGPERWPELGRSPGRGEVGTEV